MEILKREYPERPSVDAAVCWAQSETQWMLIQTRRRVWSFGLNMSLKWPDLTLQHRWMADPCCFNTIRNSVLILIRGTDLIQFFQMSSALDDEPWSDRIAQLSLAALQLVWYRFQYVGGTIAIVVCHHETKADAALVFCASSYCCKKCSPQRTYTYITVPARHACLCLDKCWNRRLLSFSFSGSLC